MFGSTDNIKVICKWSSRKKRCKKVKSFKASAVKSRSGVKKRCKKVKSFKASAGKRQK